MDDASIIIQEWGLDPALHSKEAILEALRARISELVIKDPMAFIQLMYRLDIAEDRLGLVIDEPNADQMIAQMIWDRQLQKSVIRKMTPPRTDTGDEDLDW